MFYVQIIININHANAIMLKYYFHYQLSCSERSSRKFGSSIVLNKDAWRLIH